MLCCFLKAKQNDLNNTLLGEILVLALLLFDLHLWTKQERKLAHGVGLLQPRLVCLTKARHVLTSTTHAQKNTRNKWHCMPWESRYSYRIKDRTTNSQANLGYPGSKAWPDPQCSWWHNNACRNNTEICEQANPERTVKSRGRKLKNSSVDHCLRINKQKDRQKAFHERKVKRILGLCAGYFDEINTQTTIDDSHL